MEVWAVIYGGVGANVPTLIFKDESGVLLASLSLEKSTGRFIGRERGSVGAVACTSNTPDQEAFKLLADPSDWYRHQETVQNPEEYMDDFTFAESVGPQIDWAPFEYNLADSIQKDLLVQSDTAVVLIACDRHQYFGRMIEGLAKNPEIHQMPVFLFLDVPWQDARQEEPDKHREITKKYLPHCVVIERPRNYGCGRNIIDARIQLFTNMGYDKLFLFEDDMVPTPQYMRVCLNLLKWGQKNYSNIGAVQAWNKCVMSKDARDQRISEVHATFTNWWGYLQTAESWRAMEPYVLKYQHLFLRGQYSHRAHRSILRFFHRMRQTAPLVIGSQPFTPDGQSWDASKTYFDGPPTGQDAITMHSFEQTGFTRLTTTVNRGLYIGQHGIHMNPRMFERDGFPHVEYVEYPEDTDRDEFNPRSSVKYPEIPVSSEDQHSNLKVTSQL